MPAEETRWRTPMLAPHLDRLATLIHEQPDRTLAEVQAALGTSACLATIWRTVKQIGFTLKKNGARVRTRSAGRHRRPDRLAPRHARH